MHLLKPPSQSVYLIVEERVLRTVIGILLCVRFGLH